MYIFPEIIEFILFFIHFFICEHNTLVFNNNNNSKNRLVLWSGKYGTLLSVVNFQEWL
jgi:hypothetical protein